MKSVVAALSLLVVVASACDRTPTVVNKPQITAQADFVDVPPQPESFPITVLYQGENFHHSIFISEGNQPFTATIDFGDGAGPQPAEFANNYVIVFSHTYLNPGNYAFHVVVTDAAGLTGELNATVPIWSREAATQQLAAFVIGDVPDGYLPAKALNPLTASLDAAAKQYARGNTTAANNQLNAFINKLNALVASGQAQFTHVYGLILEAQRIQNSVPH